MVLSKEQIQKRCEKDNLITNLLKDNIQTCSYDLRLGKQYYFHKKNDRGVKISTLKEGEVLSIPPHAICYIITEEAVNMPDDLTASISLSFGLINKGVMLAAQPPYDPGYRGKTVALLHNLSDKHIEIHQGDHVLNIVFTELDKKVDQQHLYKGRYQGLDDLSKYCKEERVGAVFKLNEEMNKASTRFNRFLPQFLTIVTTIIAVLTILTTVIFSNATIFNKNVSPQFFVDENKHILTVNIDGKLYNLNINDSAAETPTDTPSNNTPQFYVNEEQNTLIISVDDKKYEIDIKETNTPPANN